MLLLCRDGNLARFTDKLGAVHVIVYFWCLFVVLRFYFIRTQPQSRATPLQVEINVEHGSVTPPTLPSLPTLSTATSIKKTNAFGHN